MLRHPFDLAYQGFALKNRVPMDISEATRVSPTLHNGAVTPLGGGLTLSPLKFASWGRQGKDVCVGRGGGVGDFFIRRNFLRLSVNITSSLLRSSLSEREDLARACNYGSRTLEEPIETRLFINGKVSI